MTNFIVYFFGKIIVLYASVYYTHIIIIIITSCRYSPTWALASCAIRLHWSLSWAFLLHPSIPDIHTARFNTQDSASCPYVQVTYASTDTHWLFFFCTKFTDLSLQSKSALFFVSYELNICNVFNNKPTTKRHTPTHTLTKLLLINKQWHWFYEERDDSWRWFSVDRNMLEPIGMF
jgi:hypothetical protein